VAGKAGVRRIDDDPVVMQAYLDWEHGLVAQLRRDGTHGFTVLSPQRKFTAS
jgi:hypothetical protein